MRESINFSLQVSISVQATVSWTEAKEIDGVVDRFAIDGTDVVELFSG